MNDDLASLYTLFQNAYVESKTPVVGQLFNQMRVCGNLTAWLWNLECEMSDCDANNSLGSEIFQTYVSLVNSRQDLLVTKELGGDWIVGNSSFPAVWTVLEFLLCLPKSAHSNENENVEEASATAFGEGVIVCAQMMIIAAGQQGLYESGSMTRRALMLYKTARACVKGKLAEFIGWASLMEQTQRFTEVMVNPYIRD
jgi:hypothetical protein